MRLRSSRYLAPILVLLVFVFLSAGAATAAPARLVPESTVHLDEHLSWPLDLAVAPDGTSWIVGRDAADERYVVLAIGPDGRKRASFGGDTLVVPLRLALTASGRVVVSEICRAPSCTAALVVFSPDGTLERTIDLPRGTVTQLVPAGGERMAALTQYLGDDGAHFGYRLVDAASGEVVESRRDLLPADGVDRLYVQKSPSPENCSRDVYLAALPGNGLVAGYSGENAFWFCDGTGHLHHRVALRPFTAPSLPEGAERAEDQASVLAAGRGRDYAPDRTCGLFRGLAVTPEKEIVVTARGRRGADYVAELYGPDGTPRGELLSPRELNYTLAFAGDRAWGLSRDDQEGWLLVRYRRH